MVKMNFTNNQTVFEYVIYMMLGSYFDKAVCKNRNLERNLYVQYLEQKERSQIQMENICIKYVEKKMLPHLPEKFWEQEVEVRFCPTDMDGVKEVQFHGKDFVLRVGGIYRGKRETKLHCELQHKASKKEGGRISDCPLSVF